MPPSSARCGSSPSTRRSPAAPRARSTPTSSRGWTPNWPRAPSQPTLLALHHPPIATGIAPWDEIGLAPADRAALGRVLDAHPQVRRLVAGHVHQIITGSLAGRPVLTVPSTYVQARLDFTASELQLGAGPRGFALHALVDGEIVSYVRTLG